MSGSDMTLSEALRMAIEACKSNELLYGADNRARQSKRAEAAAVLERHRAEQTRRRCECGTPSGHVDTLDFCCDCGGYKP